MKKQIIVLLACLMVIYVGCNMPTSTEGNSSVCEKEGCIEQIYKNNLCTDHYVESELLIERCITKGCSQPIYKEKLCADHYVEWEIGQRGENAISASPEPTVTNTPVPIATNTPIPTPTNTPKPTPTNTPKPSS